QSRFDPLRRVVHFHGRLQRSRGLFFQIRSTAVPELRGVEHRIEDRRVVARPLLPTVPDGDLDVVAAADAQVMAAIAANEVAARKPRIEPQHAAELDLRRYDLLPVELRHALRDGLE